MTASWPLSANYLVLIFQTSMVRTNSKTITPPQMPGLAAGVGVGEAVAVLRKAAGNQETSHRQQYKKHLV